MGQFQQQTRQFGSIDPYRLLFPIGYALAIFGTLIWILFYSGVTTSYPATIHANAMMGGFQFCIAAGFLMTAIPRFTGTASANLLELSVGFTLGILLLAFSVAAAFWPEAVTVFFWLSFGFSLFLGVYFARRFAHRSHSPPPTFSFVALGLIFSVLGALGLALSSHLSGSVVILARLVFYHGLMLSLVLGVGSRLVTANLGWMQNPIIQISIETRTTRPFDFLRSSYGIAWAWTFAFAASFAVEAFYSVQIGRIIRALVVSGVIIPTWKLHRLPRSKTKLAFWLWVSSWFVFLGCWGYALFSAWAIAAAHLTFIGGFSLMIFMIASRVTLSHGGYELSFESKSHSYALIGTSTILAAALRVLAGFFPEKASLFIMTAALVLLFSLSAWGISFLGKVIFLNPEKRTST